MRARLPRFRLNSPVGTRVARQVLILFVACGLVPAVLTLALAEFKVRDALMTQYQSRVGETIEALGMSTWDRLALADGFAAVLLQQQRNAATPGLITETFDAILLLPRTGGGQWADRQRQDPVPADLDSLPRPTGDDGVVAVRTEAGRSPLHGSPGDYFWGGAYGTYFWVDPKEKLFAVLMMQSPAARLPYRYLMRELVYQAIVD